MSFSHWEIQEGRETVAEAMSILWSVQTVCLRSNNSSATEMMNSLFVSSFVSEVRNHFGIIDLSFALRRALGKASRTSILVSLGSMLACDCGSGEAAPTE